LVRLTSVFFVTILIGTGWSSAASAQDSVRSDLADAWIVEKQENQSFYQSIPVTQVVPTFNTITYAVLAEYLDATIRPEETGFQQAEESLHLGGYTFAPHVSISLKRIGLGLAAEVGKKTANFYRDGANVGNQDTAQESALDYRGFGLSAHYILPQPFGKRVKPSLTVGYGAVSAKHSVSTFVYETGEATIDESQRQTFNYNVSRHEIGLNIGIQLLKKFTLIPWINHEYIDTSAGTSAVGSFERLGASTYPDIAREDLELFWHSSPRTRYGLDFAVRVYKTFEVHFGGLIGSLLSTGPKDDRIEDDSYSFSVSLEQKGS
jgi:hypothetical protein